jgi:hypothetical protein
MFNLKSVLILTDGTENVKRNLRGIRNVFCGREGKAPPEGGAALQLGG